MHYLQESNLALHKHSSSDIEKCNAKYKKYFWIQKMPINTKLSTKWYFILMANAVYNIL